MRGTSKKSGSDELCGAIDRAVLVWPFKEKENQHFLCAFHIKQEPYKINTCNLNLLVYQNITIGLDCVPNSLLVAGWMKINMFEIWESLQNLTNSSYTIQMPSCEFSELMIVGSRNVVFLCHSGSLWSGWIFLPWWSWKRNVVFFLKFLYLNCNYIFRLKYQK